MIITAYGGFKTRFKTVSKHCFILNKIQPHQRFFISFRCNCCRQTDKQVSRRQNEQINKMSSENKNLS